MTEWSQVPYPASGQNSRTWSILAHATALAGGFLGGLPAFLGPLVIFLVFKKDPLVRRHAAESLNFQITVLLYAAISGALILVLIGFLLLPAVAIFWLVCTIMATIKASNDQFFTYPFTLRFIK